MSYHSVDEIIKALHKANLIIRPYIIFIHPDDFKDIKEVFPKIEDKFYVLSTPYIEKGKSFLVKREYLESLDISFKPYKIEID